MAERLERSFRRSTDMTPLPVTVRMSAIDPKIAPLIGSHYRESVLTR